MLALFHDAQHMYFSTYMPLRIHSLHGNLQNVSEPYENKNINIVKIQHSS